MNKVILSGNLCKDIELKYTQSQKAVLQNTIAVRNDFKNANGEYDSQFINIVVWNQTAEYLNNNASKGSKLLVEGRLTNRTYDKQDGTKGYITEIVCDKVELLDYKKKESVQEEQKETDPYEEMGKQIEIEDDSLPF